MIASRDTGVVEKAVGLTKELRNLATEYGEWLQDSAGKAGE